MLVVIALGGNALLRRGDPLTAENQSSNARIAAEAVAEVIKAGHRVVITHGNGPQVGLLALQNQAYKSDESYPLDVLGAETEGMIGYLIERELENFLPERQRVAVLLTQIEVDPNDSAFEEPSKPIGPIYSAEQAGVLAGLHNWTISRDGDQYRRVVASPMPKHIPDLSVIRLLIDNEITVICAGGGGIPVARRKDGSLIGIEAVIDKDHASGLLAREIGADALLTLTDVEGVFRNWQRPDQSIINRTSTDEIRTLDLAAGSMQPKVAAACDFVDATGGIAGIGCLADALKILEGKAGTVIA